METCPNPLAPLVLIGGLLIVRKVQRFDMVGVYLGANLVVTLPPSINMVRR
jgi:hypothetical protein